MRRNFIESIALVCVVIGMGGLMYSNVKLSNQVKEAEVATQKCMEGQSLLAKVMKAESQSHVKRLKECLDERNKTFDRLVIALKRLEVK